MQGSTNIGHHPGPFDYNTLLNGIKKWPKHTTTSPSGQHLGIYKSLGKHVIDWKTNNKNQPTKEVMTGILKDGRDVLYVVFDLMTLAM